VNVVPVHSKKVIVSSNPSEKTIEYYEQLLVSGKNPKGKILTNNEITKLHNTIADLEHILGIKHE
jgi:hypothetical protein